MPPATTTDWNSASLEDIDQAVNGSIFAGAFIKTPAKRSVLDRLLYALDRAYTINRANPHIKLIIYNLHREMDGKPPLDSLAGRDVHIFSIMVSRASAYDVSNELFIIEAGKIVRIGGFGIENDLFSSRLTEFIMAVGAE
ncbi:MAG: hypothetical protein C0619_06870 [Desulfuromonas sp.]|nr:MAG: hypothetical protein C0619_06870 [Desulfuromonas sp.]